MKRDKTELTAKIMNRVAIEERDKYRKMFGLWVLVGMVTIMVLAFSLMDLGVQILRIGMWDELVVIKDNWSDFVKGDLQSVWDLIYGDVTELSFAFVVSGVVVIVVFVIMFRKELRKYWQKSIELKRYLRESETK